jgi:A/G-specific adenine glycosylase
MLQQTQVKTVVDYWNRWIRSLPDIRSVAKANPTRIHKLWEGLGYYTRARNLQRAAQVILHDYGGRFPTEYGQVLALPGIGRYTAGAICSIAFNQPTPILDGNVIRVLSRLFGISGDPRKRRTNSKLWKLAEELVQQAARVRNHRPPCSHLNQALMELGALVCTPKKPQCDRCPVAKFCVALKQNRVGSLPTVSARKTTSSIHQVALVAEIRGKLLVRKRPAGVVNAHLWEFPNVQLGESSARNGAAKRQANGDRNNADSLRQSAARAFRMKSSDLSPLTSIKHSITRYRIHLSVFRTAHAPPKSAATAAGRWLTRTQLAKLPFTAAHGKVLAQFFNP